MIHKIDVILPLEESGSEVRWKEEAARKLKANEVDILGIRLLKRSIVPSRLYLIVETHRDLVGLRP